MQRLGNTGQNLVTQLQISGQADAECSQGPKMSKLEKSIDFDEGSIDTKKIPS